MRGTPQALQTGKIRIDIDKDEQRTFLADGGNQQVLRSYSVAAKVLAADMLDIEKFQNHFLLSAASLGSQLLRTYDLGLSAAGQAVELTPDRIAGFLFDILHGKIAVPTLDAKFSLDELAGSSSARLLTQGATS